MGGAGERGEGEREREETGYHVVALDHECCQVKVVVRQVSFM